MKALLRFSRDDDSIVLGDLTINKLRLKSAPTVDKVGVLDVGATLENAGLGEYWLNCPLMTAEGTVDVQVTSDTTRWAVGVFTPDLSGVPDAIAALNSAMSNMSVATRVVTTLPTNIVSGETTPLYQQINVMLYDADGNPFDPQDHDGGSYSTVTDYPTGHRVYADDGGTRYLFRKTAGDFGAGGAAPTWTFGTNDTMVDAAGNTWTCLGTWAAAWAQEYGDRCGFGVVAEDSLGAQFDLFADGTSTPLDLVAECHHRTLSVKPQVLKRTSTGIYYFYLPWGSDVGSGSVSFWFSWFDTARGDADYTSSEHRKILFSTVIEESTASQLDDIAAYAAVAANSAGPAYTILAALTEVFYGGGQDPPPQYRFVPEAFTTSRVATKRDTQQCYVGLAECTGLDMAATGFLHTATSEFPTASIARWEHVAEDGAVTVLAEKAAGVEAFAIVGTNNPSLLGPGLLRYSYVRNGADAPAGGMPPRATVCLVYGPGGESGIDRYFDAYLPAVGTSSALGEVVYWNDYSCYFEADGTPYYVDGGCAIPVQFSRDANVTAQQVSERILVTDGLLDIATNARDYAEQALSNTANTYITFPSGAADVSATYSEAIPDDGSYVDIYARSSYPNQAPLLLGRLSAAGWARDVAWIDQPIQRKLILLDIGVALIAGTLTITPDVGDTITADIPAWKTGSELVMRDGTLTADSWGGGALVKLPAPEVVMAPEDITAIANTVAAAVGAGVAVAVRDVDNSNPAPGSLGAAVNTAAAGTGGGVPGGIADTLTINDGLGNPIPDCRVWITSDLAGAVLIDGPKTTEDDGTVAFTLTAGLTYYCWRRKAGVSFTNPASFTATEDAP